MYIARGLLNLRSREVLRDLASPAELHRSVMRLFDADRRASGVLHRLEGSRDAGAALVVQSLVAPSAERLPRGYFLVAPDDGYGPPLETGGLRVSRQRLDSVRAGERLVFRLVANTTRKVGTASAADGTKSNGRRVPVRGDEARMEWLTRHAAAAGFRIEDARVVEEPRSGGPHAGARVTFEGARFDGILNVTDASAFQAAVRRGFGPAKAFGFGLLSLRRLPADPGPALLEPLGS
jgi:CRISPR system Cascade subunit CasE